MLCCFSGTAYDVITFLICITEKRKYLQNENRYSEKENAILHYFEKSFKQAAITFYFIGTLRGNGANLCIPKFNLSFITNSFTYKCGQLWNKLPDDVKLANNVNIFKSKLSSIPL